MKPSALVGAAIVLLLLAAGILAPMFQSAQRKATAQARAQADLARRQLARVSAGLPRLDAIADVDALQAADLSSAISQAAEDLKGISDEYARLMRVSAERAQRDGLPAPEIQPLAPNASGVNRALDGFAAAVKANQALLQQATRDAQSARGIDSGALGVTHVLGMAKYVEAAQLLAEAEALRALQVARQAELLQAATTWKLMRGQADHFRGLDAEPILAQLRADLTELRELRDQANARVAALEAEVRSRTQELLGDEAAGTPGVVGQMQALQQELLALEERGFKAGADDAPDGFNAYRTRYLELTGQLQELQQREQELRFGGRPGAALVGRDPLTAELQGGERVIGLADLEPQLAGAREVAERLDGAHVSLEAHIVYVQKTGEDADEEIQRYQQRSAQLETRQKELAGSGEDQAGEIRQLDKAAMEKEEAALSAAEQAVSAFAQAATATRNWVSAARELQQQRDPNRVNERLRLLLDDPYIEHVSQSAEAAARMLVARIQALRMEAARTLIEDMGVLATINPALAFDAAPYQTVADTAQKAGLEALEKARQTYERLANDSKAANSSWVPRAALAAAQHLTWRLDPAATVELPGDQVGTFRDLAAQTITAALERRDQHPDLRPYVPYRTFLGRAFAAATIAPAAPPAAEESFFGEEESPEPPPADSDEDFFTDD